MPVDPPEVSRLGARERLIVALDFNTGDEAGRLIDRLGDAVGFYKVGWQLFIREGITFVQSLTDGGKRVFLDLKMDDIGETIRAAVRNLPHADGIELLTIHGSGQTAAAARAGREGRQKPYLLVLTALSSQDDADVRDASAESGQTRAAYVRRRAETALRAGCEGLIASGASIRQLREEFSRQFGHFLIVSPGIRPVGSGEDDHKNCMTPFQAIAAGADFLVVGRPIRDAADPGTAAEAIVVDIDRALAQR